MFTLIDHGVGERGGRPLRQATSASLGAILLTGAVEVPADWALGGTALVAAIIFGVAGGVILLLAFRSYLASRHAQVRVDGSRTQLDGDRPGAGLEAEGRTRQFLDAEEGRSEALGWSSLASDGRAAHTRRRVSAGRPAASRASKTILIADDDQVIVLALRRRLEQRGFQVFSSPDAAHALIGAMKLRPDLLILDVNLPGGNGMAVCEMMASDPHYAGIPVIIHTSRGDEATKQRCQQLGARHVEKSPQSWAEILTLVTTLIGESGGETATAQPEFQPEAETDVLPVPLVSPDREPESVQATAGELPAGDPGLAATPEEVVATAVAAPVEPAPESPLQVSGRPQVLCIDGPEGELESVERRLAVRGVDVTRVSDLEQGFWTCFIQQPHVVVIQTDARGKRLREGLSRFAQHPVTRKLPVLLVIDRALTEEERPESGRFMVLEQPKGWQEILEKLRKLIPIGDADDSGSPVATMHRGKLYELAAGDRAEPREGRPASLRILSIDDDPDVTHLLALRLEPYGIEVKGAISGTQGLLLGVSERPDLILLDLQIPEGHGKYVLGMFRNNPHTKAIPVVILTAETDPEVRREMLSLGAAGYLNKPVRWNELVTELRRHLPLPEALLHDSKVSEDELLATP